MYCQRKTRRCLAQKALLPCGMAMATAIYIIGIGLPSAATETRYHYKFNSFLIIINLKFFRTALYRVILGRASFTCILYTNYYTYGLNVHMHIHHQLFHTK